jgi:hypothetical protein
MILKAISSITAVREQNFALFATQKSPLAIAGIAFLGRDLMDQRHIHMQPPRRLQDWAYYSTKKQIVKHFGENTSIKILSKQLLIFGFFGAIIITTVGKIFWIGG